jgi:hypothetical protein
MSDFPTFSAMSSLPELTLVAWTHAGEGYPTSSPVPTRRLLTQPMSTSSLPTSESRSWPQEWDRFSSDRNGGAEDMVFLNALRQGIQSQ